MTTSCISAIGAYVPPSRISASAFEEAGESFEAPGVRQTAVPGVDEDTVTMGYEAATRALSLTDDPASDVDRLFFATTTPPIAEEDCTVVLSEALGMRSSTRGRLFTGHTGAGVQALDVALRQSTPTSRTLVVVSDAPRGSPDSSYEHAAGAAAVAVYIAPDGAVNRVDGTEFSSYRPGIRFRRSGESTIEGLGINQYDRDAISETVEGALSELDALDNVDAITITSPDGNTPRRVLRATGLDPDRTEPFLSVHSLGDTGTVGPVLDAARAIDDGLSSVLLIGYGSGSRATLLHLECTGEVPVHLKDEPDRSLSYPEYLHNRGHLASESPSGGGAYVSIPAWIQSIPTRFHLRAGRCDSCGSVSAPPEGACPLCGHFGDVEQVALSKTGEIEALTTIEAGRGPPEFSDIQSQSGEFCTAIVSFDAVGGGSASLPMLVLQENRGDLAVGDRVCATIRQIFTQEGVTRYGCKVGVQ